MRLLARLFLLFNLMLSAALALPPGHRLVMQTTQPTSQPQPRFSVLVFSRTAGYRHASINAALPMLTRFGSQHNFIVDITEDPRRFTSEMLADYACVVFLNTSGDVLDDNQQVAFEEYIQAGGGYVGIHAAADTEYDWPFYGELVGAYFAGHPAVQPAVLQTVEADHPSTRHLPATLEHVDEWYNYRTNPADDPDITVLLTVDESTYEGGTMGDTHPIAWCHERGPGRAWYTGLGHTIEAYDQPFMAEHLLGGILWAAGMENAADSPETSPQTGSDSNPTRGDQKPQDAG